MAQRPLADVSGVMAMLRASTISDSSSEPSTSRTMPSSATSGSCSASRRRQAAADADDCQYCVGFTMSPRMFREVFGLRGSMLPGSYAAAAFDQDAAVTSEELRVYHYRQFMLSRRADLPLQLRESVQLDCQHRPAIVRFVTEDILPIDPASAGVSSRNAARMAEMAQVLTREGLRINRTLRSKSAAATGAAAADMHSPQQRCAPSGPAATPEADTVIVQTNLGNCRRQQSKLVVKAFVRPEAYAAVLEDVGRGSEAAVPFADDPAWLYRARWVTTLPFMFAHPSITRINTNVEAVILRGDITGHGFRPGPKLSFLRASQPTPAQIYYSTVYPYFFVSTSVQPAPARGARVCCTTHTRDTEAPDSGRAPPPAHGSSGTGVSELVEEAEPDVHVACFDAEDLMHVIDAVVRNLAEQDVRDADAVARATRRTHGDDVGLEAELVPVPFGVPERVYDAGGGGEGFTAEELAQAAQQQALDCEQYAAIARRLPQFTAWKAQHTDRNSVVSHANIPAASGTPFSHRGGGSHRGSAGRSWRHSRDAGGRYY